MVQKIGIVLGLFVIGFTTGYFVKSYKVDAEKTPAQALTTEPARTQEIDQSNGVPEAKPAPEYQRVYDRLGLKQLDTLYSVNGFTVPEGIGMLLSGFDAGHLCVVYMPQGTAKKHEVCYDKNEQGEEKVRDKEL